MSMSRKLTDEEKMQRQLRRDEKAVAKEAHPQVDKYGAKILRILREEASDNPNIKYNSEYFEKRFDVSNITILRAIWKLKQNNLIKPKQVHGSYAIEEQYPVFTLPQQRSAGGRTLRRDNRKGL